MSGTAVCHLAQLRASLKAPAQQATLQQATLQGILSYWIRHCDGALDSTHDRPNLMHSIGIGLCCTMAATAPLPAIASLQEDEALGDVKEVLLVHSTPLREMSWSEIIDTLSSLQMEFHNLYRVEENGFVCCVNIEAVLLILMRRMGHWMAHRVKLHDAGEAVRSMYEADEEEFSRLHLAAMTDALDSLHAMLAANLILMTAKRLPQERSQSDCLNAVTLYNHHREASLDAFYELSMVSDLAPGAIMQYKHKFRVLFHSISQVIYFHYPAYDRQIQRAMPELSCYGCSAVNLLPLLQQVDPSTPIRYEHTGAYHTPTLAQSPWQWVVVAGFVLLVQGSGETWCATDLRQLHLFKETQEQNQQLANDNTSSADP